MCKKMIGLFLAVVLVLSLAACSGGNTEGKASDTVKTTAAQESGAPAESEKTTESTMPAEFKTVTMALYGDMSERMKQFSQKELQDKLKAYCNTGLDIIYVPWSEYGSGKRLDLMMASGEKLDMFLSDKGWIESLVSKKMAKDLTEYAAKYLDENYKKVVAKEAFDFFTIDGKLYSIPIGFKPMADVFYSVCVRQDLLEEVGMTEVKSLDDLKQFALKCKEKHPDMFASADGAMGIQQYLRGITDKNYTLFEDFLINQDDPKDVQYIYESDIYKKWVAFNRELFQADLTPRDVLTIQAGTLQLFESGKYMWMRGTCGTTLIENEPNLKKNVPTAKTREYLLSPEKPKFKLLFHNTNWVVPENSEVADRVMMVCNFMQSNVENIRFAAYGVEGTDYKLVGDKVERINKDELLPQWMMFNIHYPIFTSDVPDEFINVYKSWDEGARVAHEFGFTFIKDAIKAEKAKLDAVGQEKFWPISAGVVEYDKYYEKAIQAMKDAGLETYKAEFLKQWNAMLDAKK